MVVLSEEEKQLLSEMVIVDRKIGPGQNKAFHLFPVNFDEPLPTLAHSSVPFGKAVQEGSLSALVDAGFLRRVKLEDSKQWFEVTELGRRYDKRVQDGGPDSMGDAEGVAPSFQQVTVQPGATMSTFHGNITGSNVNINATLTNVAESIGTLPSADEPTKAELTKVIRELREQLNRDEHTTPSPLPLPPPDCPGPLSANLLAMNDDFVHLLCCVPYRTVHVA